MLETGQPAPDFSLPIETGETLSLNDFKGRKLVLYFYPKDSTPGCTTEAKDFTALKQEFTDANAVVIGASKDSLKRHQNFINKQDLSISLISDEEGVLCESYGVWILKKLYGREYMGIERATFLIDEKGTIRNIWHKVKVKGHAAAVLEAVKAL
ncbi:thioredoxin-dependent thiol peroxidase [Paremcibacter congregatus]|uniref:thioredoxin-dependent peroxiredoxin n=1 Tax=Paremcibacter congregatus TaxID=2043170 RepID=A0A2G4YMR3_9PROT|nr:thioredoxin-dependent thiol peroxidase [Paremcibacter congregatus]PHZ83612.1 thioredoxin-dependent thiol peroxidase [Paremcibacter congregatus]QDE27312.1 thioredoxin-dependent thiol peroxidase [Paremcibacter congregatus]